MVPSKWMPECKMDRVIVHWTAGSHSASGVDKEHYHIIVEGDGKLVRGDHSIGVYSAHTRGLNTRSIGISAASMAGAVESPFTPGRYPTTLVQWNAMATAVADLCARYGIPVTPKTVLSHAEVQGTLKIKQRGKWDFTRLAFDPAVKGAKACGERLRADVSAAINGVPLADEDQLDDVAPKDLEQVQQRLKDLGYPEVGTIDGKLGTKTRAAVLAFRSDNDLPLTESWEDAEFVKALFITAEPRAIAPKRANATLSDVREKGSRIIDATDAVKVGGGALAAGSVAAGAVESSGVVDQVREVGETAEQIKDAVSPFQSVLLFFADWWWIGAALIGAIVVWFAVKAARARLDDHRTGKTA